jgi:hypothetical protein
MVKCAPILKRSLALLWIFIAITFVSIGCVRAKSPNESDLIFAQTEPVSIR